MGGKKKEGKPEEKPVRLIDLFAQFLKFFGKEYEEIKHIPVSRLWGYFDYMEKYYKSQEEAMDEQKRKFEKVEEADWDSEVKELKRKLNGRGKT